MTLKGEPATQRKPPDWRIDKNLKMGAVMGLIRSKSERKNELRRNFAGVLKRNGEPLKSGGKSLTEEQRCGRKQQSFSGGGGDRGGLNQGSYEACKEVSRKGTWEVERGKEVVGKKGDVKGVWTHWAWQKFPRGEPKQPENQKYE